MKVSVITSLHNYRRFVKATLDSFMNQDFKESEIILVDDASTDDPYPVIKPYIGDRVKYIRLDENHGCPHARNVAVREARGEALVVLDADDMFTKQGITYRYNKLVEGFDFVHGPVLDWREGKTSPSRLWDKWKKQPTYRHVHAQGTMMLRKIHKEIGLYDVALHSKEDREMWARVFNNGYKIGACNDGEYVALYRRHDKQVTVKKAKNKKWNDRMQVASLKKIEQRKSDLSGLEFLE